MPIHKAKAQRFSALAYLLGIELMPRIRNWKDQTLVPAHAGCLLRAYRRVIYGTVDWDLIATLLPDMMRVAVSIRTGNILPSISSDDSTAAHAKTSSTSDSGTRPSSPDNFLAALSLRSELRRTIQAATNKSERFNQFVQWVSFGGIA